MQRASCVLSLALIASATLLAQTTTYDLSAEFSTTTASRSPFAYLRGSTPFPTLQPNWIAGNFQLPQPAWANASTGTGHIPTVLRIGSAAIPPLDVQVGDVMIHSDDPSGPVPPSLVWTSPTSANATLTGAVWIARDIGRSVGWQVLFNGAPMSQGTVSSGDSWSRASPVPISLAKAVVPGDTIAVRFVTSTTSPFGDFVGVQMVVSVDRVAGRFLPYGKSCGGGIANTGLPTLGKTFSIDLFAQANTAAVALVGATQSALDLAAIGAPGCTLYCSTEILGNFGTNASGRGSYALAVPNVAGFVGGGVFCQCAYVSYAANALNILLTEGARAVIGG